MAGVRPHRAFTLIELLVVIAILGTLIAILLPSLGSARQTAQATLCLSNLHSLGLAVNLYQNDEKQYFPPYRRTSWPVAGQTTYFWGSDTDPVVKEASWLLRYCNYQLDPLWCPLLPWGSYVPQGSVNERTTTYGYNAWCLDPALWNRRDASNIPMKLKRSSDITSPTQLFVFVDSAMYWIRLGVPLFQNSTSLDPVTLTGGMANTTPTTHFRHRDRTNALLADGHAATFDLEGGTMPQPTYKLGFVGTQNVPHYDQP